MMTSTAGTSRIVALVDMDCFYVQVEERDNPHIKGKPAAVVQYKTYKGGALIAVNYEARAKGVSRYMRGDDAKEACPQVILIKVPETRGKADLTKYREAGKQVIQVLSEFSDCVERASIDEAYIDLTSSVEKRMDEIDSKQDTQDPFLTREQIILNALDKEMFSTCFVMGFESIEAWLEGLGNSDVASMDDVKLAVGAEIVGKMREMVWQKTGFRCSAGIAHNKVLAKLCGGLNKPNKQTIMPHSSVPKLWAETKVKKVRNLGGKLGDYLVDTLKCDTMSDVLKLTEKDLKKHLGAKSGSWIYNLARGYDDEPVNARQLPQSIGCSKNFFGPETLTTKDQVKHWLKQLTDEVVERIQKDYDENKRRAKTLTLYVLFAEDNNATKSCRVHPQYNQDRIVSDVLAMMERIYQASGALPVNNLGLSASRFEDESDLSNCAKISSFFEPKPISSTATSEDPQPSTSSAAAIASTSTIDEESCETRTSTNEDPNIINIPKSVVECNLFANIFRPKERNKPPKKKMWSLPGLSPSKIPYTQECERCGTLIHIYEYVAHMDAHVARDLQREINGLPPLGFDLRPATLEALEREKLKKEKEQRKLENLGKSCNKRGTKRGPGKSSAGISPKKKPINTKTKPIDTYFVKKE